MPNEEVDIDRALAPEVRKEVEQEAAMKSRDTTSETEMRKLIRHMTHPVKEGVLTIAGDEDCDIPDLTASFLLGGAQIEYPIFSDRN